MSTIKIVFNSYLCKRIHLNFVTNFRCFCFMLLLYICTILQKIFTFLLMSNMCGCSLKLKMQDDYVIKLVLLVALQRVLRLHVFIRKLSVKIFHMITNTECFTPKIFQSAENILNFKGLVFI